MAHKILEKHGKAPPSSQGLSHYLNDPSPSPTLTGLNPQKQMQFSFQNTQGAIRPTSEVFPDQIPNLALPLAAFIQPMGDLPLPLASFHSQPILRCAHCRAYLNPYCQFTSEGNLWTCNLCNHQEPVPQHYFSPLDEQGQRQDKEEKVELSHCSFDIKAGQDYTVRPPMPPTYFFLVDVSKSVSKILLRTFAENLKDLIERGEIFQESRTQIGFLTYDGQLHFYDFNTNYKVIISEENPFPHSLVFNLQEKKDQILNFLDNFHELWAQNPSDKSNFLPALETSITMLKSQGGKLFIIQQNSSLIFEECMKPSQEPSPSTLQSLQNKLTQKKQIQTQNTPQNNSQNYLRPSNATFASLAATCHAHYISVSIFLFTDCFKNIANLSQLAQLLNGAFYHYNDPFFTDRQFYNHFRNELKKEIIWESVFRIRISDGWSSKKAIGHYSVKCNDLLSTFNCTNSDTLLYEFDPPQYNNKNDNFALQTALLYTNGNGERRIRVHNYAVVLTQKIQEVYDHVDPQVLAAYIFRSSLAQIQTMPDIKSLRSQIFQKTKDIVRQGGMESLGAFVQGSLGIFKHFIFCTEPGMTLQTDYMNSLRTHYGMLPVDETYLNLVPYLFQISNSEYGYDDQEFQYPPLINLTQEELQDSEIYLLNDGLQLLLYIGKNVSQFTIDSLITSHEVPDELIEGDSFMQLLYVLQNNSRNKDLTLRIIYSNDQNENLFKYKLIDDKVQRANGYAMSYEEFVRLL